MLLSNKPELVKLSQSIISLLDSLKSNNISHAELGAKGLLEAEDAKDAILKYLEKIYSLLIKHEDSLDEVVEVHILEIIKSRLEALAKELLVVGNLVADTTVHSAAYPSQRQKFITQITNIIKTTKTSFIQYETLLRLIDLDIEGNRKSFKEEVESTVKDHINNYSNALESIKLDLDKREKICYRQIQKQKRFYQMCKANSWKKL